MQKTGKICICIFTQNSYFLKKNSIYQTFRSNPSDLGKKKFGPGVIHFDPKNLLPGRNLDCKGLRALAMQRQQFIESWPSLMARVKLK